MMQSYCVFHPFMNYAIDSKLYSTGVIVYQLVFLKSQVLIQKIKKSETILVVLTHFVAS